MLDQMKLIVIAMVLVAGMSPAGDASLEAFGRARGLCDALLLAPGDPNALEAFRAGAAGIAGADELRSRLAAVYALGLLSVGQARAATGVMDALLRGQTNSALSELLNMDTMTVECPSCSGRKSSDCPVCGGKPVCARCGGKGWMQVTMSGIQTRPACPSCRGTGSCSVCRGKGRLICAACSGQGRLLSPAKAQERYLSVLSDVRKRAFEHEHPEMLELRGEMDRARHCMDIEEAIRIVTTAVERDSDAANAPEARELIERLNLDRDEARKALETKKSLVANAERPSDNPGDAVRQVPAAVNSLLKAFARGETGAEYWSDPAKARRLFTPVSWQIGRSTIVGSFAQVPVSVEADGVGPDAVRSVVFYLECRGGWKITRADVDRH